MSSPSMAHNPSPYCEKCKEPLRFVSAPRKILSSGTDPDTGESFTEERMSEKDFPQQVCPNPSCELSWSHLKEDPNYFTDLEISDLKKKNYELRKQLDLLNAFRLAFEPNYSELGVIDGISLEQNQDYARMGVKKVVPVLDMDEDALFLFIKKCESVVLEANQLFVDKKYKVRVIPEKAKYSKARDVAAQERVENSRPAQKPGRKALSIEDKMINSFIKNMMQLNHKLDEKDARVMAEEMVKNLGGAK